MWENWVLKPMAGEASLRTNSPSPLIFPYKIREFFPIESAYGEKKCTKCKEKKDGEKKGEKEEGKEGGKERGREERFCQ